MEPTVRPTSASVPIALDAVAWVRGIRDAMYERTMSMSREDFAAYVNRRAAAVSADHPHADTTRRTG